MNRDTIVITLKGLCYVGIGVFTPWTAALAQWVNSDQWPSKIIWIGVILPASVVGGASQLLSFLSNSFQQYKERNGNGKTVPPTNGG